MSAFFSAVSQFASCLPKTSYVYFLFPDKL
jgi:hypothetical protein